MIDPSESVTRFKGSVPTGTARPAGRMRQPEGSSVDPSGNDPGTRRVARSAAPAMAGSASRERLSMSGNMAARGTAGIPLAFRRDDRPDLSSHPAYPLGPRVVPAARRAPGPPRRRHGRSDRAAAGRPGVPQLLARRPDGAGRGLPAGPPRP